MPTRFSMWLVCAIALAGCSLDFDAFAARDAGRDAASADHDAGVADDSGSAMDSGHDAGRDAAADSGCLGASADANACLPEDPCLPDPCGEHMACAPKANKAGYECTCIAGYELHSGACKDVDECLEGTHGCHPSAACKNTVGSYDCECALGYAGGGVDGNPIACTPRVTAGISHTCALRSDGRAFCWGDNSSGGLGDGSKITRTTPVAVVGLSGAVAIHAGTNAATCALLADGTGKCWGENSGQLGDGTTTDRPKPVVVKGLKNAIAMSLGAGTACAVLRDGSVQCWGSNQSGQLGDGTTSVTPRLAPAAVPGITDAVGVMVGFGFACALLRDGTAQCWGANDYGQLGTGTASATPITTPVVVDGLTDAVSLVGGTRHVCALRGDRTVMCWGLNSVDRTLVIGLSNASCITAGAYVTCAVLTDGTAKCWLVPPDVSPDNGSLIDVTTALTIAMGGDGWHACMALVDGTVGCVGSNNSGELGDDTTTNPGSTAAGYTLTTAKGLQLW